MSKPKEIKTEGEAIDEVIDVMVKLMSNNNYLKNQLDQLVERVDNLSMKLADVGKMLTIVLVHGDLPNKATQLLTLEMLSNKDFVQDTVPLIHSMSSDDLLEALQGNPMFDIPDELTDEERETFEKSYETVKEMFSIADLGHQLEEE